MGLNDRQGLLNLCSIKNPADTTGMQEREDYLENTTDEGNKRLDFRFAY